MKQEKGDVGSANFCFGEKLIFIPHRELGWPKALPTKAEVPGSSLPGGYWGIPQFTGEFPSLLGRLTRPVLRGPKGIMGMRKRTDHPLVIKKKKKKKKTNIARSTLYVCFEGKRKGPMCV